MKMGRPLPSPLSQRLSTDFWRQYFQSTAAILPTSDHSFTGRSTTTSFPPITSSGQRVVRPQNSSLIFPRISASASVENIATMLPRVFSPKVGK